ncbi:MAG: beta-glucosidase [Anaerolineae bacterium]|nr:beta-glucosidase [Anaerolineae bacterium]
MSQEFLHFPADFLWGVSTASYQIEGAVDEDGRGETIWDRFSHTPGKVKNGDTGDVACDHYHRWPEDIELLKSLNLNAYRFSVAWARILPTGRGPVNQAGIDFYSRLVDGLLEAGITPCLTLYHWDLPQPLQDEGGWMRRGIIDDFVAYTDVVARALGDRVKFFITENEPWVFTWLGYVLGEHAPGYTSESVQPALVTTHHALLAHGAAVKALRAVVPDAQVGITLNLYHTDPATNRPADLEAATRHDGHLNRWYLDPLFRGHYPSDMVELVPAEMPDIQPGDMELIAQPIDFLGINYYSRHVVADAPDGHRGGIKVVPQKGEHSAMGWEVYPDGLYAILKRVHADYAPRAIYVTENGAPYDDVVTDDGQVHDPERQSYLQRHFQAAARAIADGVPLKGYFVWSLIDNFEWAFGYSLRFGVTYVDFETQQRIIKDSGKYMAELAAANV